MEKRMQIKYIKISQATKVLEEIKALEKELEEKGLGRIDHDSLEIVFEEENGAEVVKLMDKHILCK